MRKQSVFKQLALILGVSAGSMFGGAISMGCSSTSQSPSIEESKPVITATASPDPKPKAEEESEPESKAERPITLSLSSTVGGGSSDLSWYDENWDPYEDTSSTIEIDYKDSDSPITFEMERGWYYYRATRYAILDRMTDHEGDLRMQQRPTFPISLSYRIPQGGRSWHALANYELISSARISLDNLTAAALYEIGEQYNLNDNIEWRAASAVALFLEMLATSRATHEFAHGYDSTVRNNRQLPLEGLLYAIPDGDEQINYTNLLASQGAGLNHSASMALQYWRQAETRGNIVSALGFLLSRNDPLIQWIYGFVINDGNPEFIHQRRLQALAGIREQHIKTVDDFKEDFEQNEIEPDDKVDPAIWQVTGHGDIVAYMKLLEIMGYGNAHRDKDLAILLGTNAFTAYFWQSIWEVFQYIKNGKQTHERWRLLGPMEWPVFSTYRLPGRGTIEEGAGYLTQVRLSLAFRHEIINRVTIIGGHDLDPILGDLNTSQLGAELSGSLPGNLDQFQWSVGGVCTFDRRDWRYVGNTIRGSIAYTLGPVSFSVSMGYHDNDPLQEQVHLQENGFFLQTGLKWTIGREEPKTQERFIMDPPPIILAKARHRND